MKLVFVSKNKFKHAEAVSYLATLGIEVESNDLEIQEIQTIDTEALVRDKAARAFSALGRPLFVEHTGLYLELLNGFPGGLTDVFWETLGKERFSDLFASEEVKATAVTYIGYVDGRRIHLFRGELEGRIVQVSKVDKGFQWDCVFKPMGFDQTFSEMGDTKNEISMRSIALRKLQIHLQKEQP
ncbi:MAG: non-canonical purine NTP pyrophosphatase [Betaproteobacteria bacterium]